MSRNSNENDLCIHLKEGNLDSSCAECIEWKQEWSEFRKKVDNVKNLTDKPMIRNVTQSSDGNCSSWLIKYTEKEMSTFQKEDPDYSFLHIWMNAGETPDRDKCASFSPAIADRSAVFSNKRIKIETQVDNSSWNEENTAKRLCRMSNADIDEESADKEKFYVTNVENKCLQIELVAFPDVFKSPQSLRKAIKILINQLIDAGEVDTSIPGRMDIEFTIKTLLTKEEMEVAFSVFGGQDNLDESTENGLDLKPKLQDHISVFQTVTTETKASDNSDSEMDFRPIDEQFVTVKPESISARYDDFFITVENVKCLLKIIGLPENVEVLDETVQALDNKGNNTYNVELILECPKTWNDEDVYANLNSNLSKLHGYFHIDLLEQPSDGNITLQTTVEENVFLSKTSLESAFQQLLSRIRTVCNVQSSKYEELSVTAAVLSVSDQRAIEDEKKTIKRELKKSPITTEDNNVKCQFCKKEFECYKCTAKIEHIRTLSLTNRMKEQTIS
ncbi:Hypothetical predicted protein, partial [Mytilus galloprovincialis]